MGHAAHVELYVAELVSLERQKERVARVAEKLTPIERHDAELRALQEWVDELRKRSRRARPDP